MNTATTPSHHNSTGGIPLNAIHGVKDTLLPCPSEAFDTLQRISSLASGATVSVSLNCMIDETDNTIKGWHCLLPADTPIHAIPFQPNMFEGITVVETLATEEHILDLLKNRESTLQKLKTLTTRLQSHSVENRVSWYRCRPNRNLPLQKARTWHVVMQPENLARYTKVDGMRVTMCQDAPLDLVPNESVPNFLDSGTWQPELGVGGFVGLYHQWYSKNGTSRQLKLYIVCQSSCQKAGLEIKQLINDIPSHTHICDLMKTEELWWLSSINTRNRNRLILEVANFLQIPVPVIEDYHASGPSNTMMAEPFTDVFLHSLYTHSSGSVSIANECLPTTLVKNGIICRLAPWEGVWVFKGPHTNHTNRLGTAFGTVKDVFPLTAVRLNEHTEKKARSMQYIVQRSAPTDHSFWVHMPHPAQARSAEAAATTEQLSINDDASSSNVDSLPHIDITTFPGHRDPTLYNIALRAWVGAKQKAIMEQHKVQATTQTRTSGAKHRQSVENRDHCYISFDDTVVLQMLQNTTWNSRYGILKLIPLALITN